MERHGLRARHELDERLRQPDRRLVHEEIARAALELGLHRSHDGRVRVPEQQRPGPEQIVDVLVATAIGEARAARVVDDHGVLGER
ncbi:MAG: hypothetical protein ABIR79_06720 [Candidatus Binatia bacterium]